MDISERYKHRIIEEATIYKGDNRKLREFERRVNAAAAELCMNDVGLLNTRGELLQSARRKVADE